MQSHRARLRLLLLYAVAALPLVVWGASRALEANNNSPIDWVTNAFPPRAAYDAHCEQFGPGDTVMISWPGCTIHEPSLDHLVEVLRGAPVFFQDERWLFESVTTGREAVAQLHQPSPQPQRFAISELDAAQRLRNHLVGPDNLTTAVVVTFNAEGLKQRQRLVDLIRRAVHELCQVPYDQMHMAGPVIDGLSVDRASQSTLSKYAGPSAIVVLLLCWLNLRSWRAAAIVFGLAMLCQGMTLALVHYSGESMSALLIVLPPLIQVLAVAGGVHLTNYYFDLASDAPHHERVAQAIRAGWLPCSLSAGTTAIGMASLMASQLEPIRAFGAYSSAGVLLTVGVLLGLLPACYLYWPPQTAERNTNRRDGVTNSWPISWQTWARAIGRLGPALSLAGVLMIAAGTFYAAQITTSVRIETMFASHHRVIEDYRWLEEHIGPLVPLDVTVAFDETSPLGYRDKLTLLWQLGEQLNAEPELAASFSAANCFPPIPNFSRLTLEQQSQIIDPIVSESLAGYQQLGLLRRDDGVEYWRVTTRTSALGTADYGDTLASVRQVVDRTLSTYQPGERQGLTSNTTGIMPLVHAIQGQLLDDLLKSFVAALGLIAVVMTLVQAGILAGIVAMLPNIFPIALFFGFLGWRGDPIDIGVVMTASVALGIAVDDTLHFLTFFQRAFADSSSREQAVLHALTHCGPAMVQTSVSCGCGLLVFALSDFLPTSRFATSMATLLGLALAGDLVLLPALLLGPLGKLCVANAKLNLADGTADSTTSQGVEAAIAA